jgi:hypothetical protein
VPCADGATISCTPVSSCEGRKWPRGGRVDARRHRHADQGARCRRAPAGVSGHAAAVGEDYRSPGKTRWPWIGASVTRSNPRATSPPSRPSGRPELEHPAEERGRQLRPAHCRVVRDGVELGEGAMQCWAAAQLARRRPGGVYSRHSEPSDSESRLRVVAAADNERSQLPVSEPAHTWYPATPAY